MSTFHSILHCAHVRTVWAPFALECVGARDLRCSAADTAEWSHVNNVMASAASADALVDRAYAERVDARYDRRALELHDRPRRVHARWIIAAARHKMRTLVASARTDYFVTACRPQSQQTRGGRVRGGIRVRWLASVVRAMDWRVLRPRRDGRCLLLPRLVAGARAS